jgi:hypothetical protein
VVESGEVSLWPLVIIRDERLYFYQQVVSKNIVYIDYDNGEYFRPSFDEFDIDSLGRIG